MGARDGGAVATRDERERVEQYPFGGARPHLADQVLRDVLGLERRETLEQIGEEPLLLGARAGPARGGERPHALLDLEEAERWQLRRGRATREQALHRLAEVDRAGPDVGRRGGAGDTKQDRPQRLSADGAPVAGLAEEEPHGGPDLLGLEPAEEVRHLPRQLASAPGLGETLAQTGELAERRHAGQNRGNRAASQVSVRPRTARGCSRRGPSGGRRGAGRRAGTDGSGAVRRPDPAAWRERALARAGRLVWTWDEGLRVDAGD